MRGSLFESVADLDSVAEWIVTIHRMAALLVPGNFRRIRSPIELSAVEPFENRRVNFRRDAEINVWPFDGASASLGDFGDAMQDHELSRVRHGERDLAFTGNLLLFG